jgi:hypothetical protein
MILKLRAEYPQTLMGLGSDSGEALSGGKRGDVAGPARCPQVRHVCVKPPSCTRAKISPKSPACTLAMPEPQAQAAASH